jgi:inosose dehydratase
MQRREFLARLAAGVTIGGVGARALAASEAAKCTLSIGTYSLKGIRLEDAIPLVAKIGYDGLEIAVTPPLDSEPDQMTPERRRGAVQLLGDSGLKLTALMENLPPAAEAAQHQAQLVRLRKVVELARDLNPTAPPLVQTVLGGGVWEDRKNILRDRLGDWLAIFNEANVTLAIKPHRGGGMSQPSEAIWLIDQLGRPPRLKMVYDYSHYAFRDLSLESTVRESLPVTAHVALKDAIEFDGKVEFRLAGDTHQFDYPKLFRLLVDGGYRGDFCCEVSAMLSNKPGYDPIVAAKTCYANMAEAFSQAQLERG